MNKQHQRYTVYKYTTPSGKIYIGMTHSSVGRRRSGGYGHNRHFQNAIRKYGWENIKEEILGEGLTLDEANLLETYYIETFNTRDMRYGYNILPGGLLHKQHPEEIREKIKWHMPNRKPVVCVETGEWYCSIKDAVRKTGVNRRSLREVLAGKKHTLGKMHWRYATDEEIRTEYVHEDGGRYS